MDVLTGRDVFEVGTRVFRWEDVLFAALAWGDWARIRADARLGLARLRVVRAAGMEPSQAELMNAAREFRYARNLVSGEEMEAWLAGWGMSVSDWLDYLRRSLLRQRVQGSAPDAAVHDASDSDVDACVMSEAVLSGSLERLANRLAGRAAMYQQLCEGGSSTPETTAAERSVLAGHAGANEVRRLLPDFTTERRNELLNLLASYEGGIRLVTGRLVQSGAVAMEIRSRYLSWIRVRVQSVCVGEPSAAWEVIHAVKQDGRALAEVADDARVPLREADVLLEDLEPAARDRLRGARVGDLVGPLATREGATVIQLLGRTAPDIRVPEVRERALDAVLERELRQAAALRVAWHWQNRGPRE